ncbi:MAG: metal-dependent transcriptional regulator [FCB group bacterium]|nr:metal-dependent transcriptional regulator [FCB group bacterium]
MRLSDNAEEILEYLWRMNNEMDKEVVNWEELKEDKDAPEIKELLDLKYISVSDDGIRLRDDGLKEAEKTVRRHRLAERLMVDVFDLKESLVEDTACRFEHLLRREVQDSICTLLGHPNYCPHHKPIPPGRCCRKAERVVKPIVIRSTELEKGSKGIVAFLHIQNSNKLQKLMAMGILPGIQIEIVQKFPSYVFKVGQTYIALDKEMARAVLVRKSDDG